MTARLKPWHIYVSKYSFRLNTDLLFTFRPARMPNIRVDPGELFIYCGKFKFIRLSNLTEAVIEYQTKWGQVHVDDLNGLPDMFHAIEDDVCT